MTAEALVRDLRGRGVKMRVEGGELVCSFPKGSLSAENKQLLTELKSEVIEILRPFRFTDLEIMQVIGALYDEAKPLKDGLLGEQADRFCRLLFDWDGAVCTGKHEEWLTLSKRQEINQLGRELNLLYTRDHQLEGTALAAAARKVLIEDVLAERAAAAFS